MEKHAVLTLLEDRGESQGNVCRGDRLEDLPDTDF